MWLEPNEEEQRFFFRLVRDAKRTNARLPLHTIQPAVPQHGSRAAGVRQPAATCEATRAADLKNVGEVGVEAELESIACWL